jgi:hypothetical protein
VAGGALACRADRLADALRGQATLCPSCRRQTPTIHGLCPHCGAAKEGGPPARPRKVLAGDFWSDLDDAVFLGVGWLAFVPGLVLVILALLFVASDLLLLAGLVLLIVPVAIRLLDHDG